MAPLGTILSKRDGSTLRYVQSIGYCRSTASSGKYLQRKHLPCGIWFELCRLDRDGALHNHRLAAFPRSLILTLYRRAVRTLLEAQPNLTTIQGMVARLLFDATGARVSGVETVEGRRFGARAVVLTTGTFARGTMHIGTGTRVGGGRAGEAPSTLLGEQLDAIGLTTERFKTGTPPRIDGRSVALRELDEQQSEIEAFNFEWSHFWSTPRRVGEVTRHPAQMPCWITWLEPPLATRFDNEEWTW